MTQHERPETYLSAAQASTAWKENKAARATSCDFKDAIVRNV
jgi:hypothetical protein